METNEGDNSAVEQALRNPQILAQIFKNFSTKFLLSSCSLVNKFWCKEAGRFIQNYRECKAKKIPGKSLCNFLQDLDHVLGQMVETGRTVPMNGLKLNDSYASEKCKKKSTIDLSLNGNLKTSLKLKHLGIFSQAGEDAKDCPVHNPIAKLLRQKCGQLESLTLSGSVSPLKQILAHDWCPLFTQLQVLDISGVSIVYEFTDEEKLAVEKLLNVAPQLKQVIVGHVAQLDLIPKEKICTLCKFQQDLDFQMITNEDLNLLEMIPVSGSSRIKNLSIFVPPFEGQSEENDHPRDELVDLVLRRRFDGAFLRLMQTGHSSLEEISIHGVFPLGQQQCLPPLSKLSKFIVKKRYAGEMGQLWDSIGTIDYERLMPGLTKMEICVHSCFYGRNAYTNVYGNYPDADGAGRFDEVVWPSQSEVIYNSSSTVRELTLELQVTKINLQPLKAVFPNVTTLSFKMLYTEYPQHRTTTTDVAPLLEIWKYFPMLVHLKITGEGGEVYRNYDADFCGLSEEEIKLLDTKSDDYLRNVHIVPIKPSIVTMSRLRKLDIRFDVEDMWGWNDYYDFEDRFYFISKVTRLVSFDRMSKLTVKLPSFMEAPESREGDDYDEDEESEEEDDDEDDEESEEEDDDEDDEESEEEDDDEDDEESEEEDDYEEDKETEREEQ